MRLLAVCFNVLFKIHIQIFETNLNYLIVDLCFMNSKLWTLELTSLCADSQMILDVRAPLELKSEIRHPFQHWSHRGTFFLACTFDQSVGPFLQRVCLLTVALLYTSSFLWRGPLSVSRFRSAFSMYTDQELSLSTVSRVSKRLRALRLLWGMSRWTLVIHMELTQEWTSPLTPL